MSDETTNPEAQTSNEPAPEAAPPAPPSPPEGEQPNPAAPAAPQPEAKEGAPVFHTLLTDDSGKVEVAEGEWVDVSAEQLEKVRALSGTGPTAAEALEVTA